MIIWLIIWLIIWWLFVIICLWLFDKCDDYLMIIWWLFSIIWLLFGDYLVIIRWLFDDYSILDYLMIIWCLFDDYLQFRSGSLLCSFLSSGHLVIMLGLPTLWATNYWQLEARRRRRWRGRYWVINRTWLWRLPLRRLCCGRSAAGRSAWSRAMNANQRLGGALSSCLLLKACCGSYRQKWENGQQRTWT